MSNLLLKRVPLVAALLLLLLGFGAVRANAQSSIVISQDSAWGGTESPYLYVYLSSPAGPGGVNVSLSTNDPVAINLPAFVHIDAGNLSNYVYFTTNTVNTFHNVTITAGGTVSDDILIKPNRPSSMTISQPSAWGGTEDPYIYVYLDAPAPPGGYDVQLSSTNPAAAACPSTVHIDAGNTSNYFYLDTSNVISFITVTFTATINGGSQQVQLQVKPNRVSDINISQPTSWGGTESPYSYVFLDAPAPPGGFDINLSSNDPAAATVPATVHIDAGNTSNFFYITTYTVSVPHTVTLTATLNGAQKQISFIVRPNRPNNINISQPTAWGGSEDPYIYVYLDAPAPPGGYDLVLH